MDAKTASRRSRTYTSLARAFSEAEPGLEAEFTRLFLGPGRRVAHPYESVYREGRTMGDTTLDVRRWLAGEGLAPDRRVLPDHVSIELALMSHLAVREARAWESGDEHEAWDLLARQESFLHDHIVTWLPLFCRRVLMGRPHQHYADLARSTEAFVTDDAAQLRTWLGLGPRRDSDTAADRDRWRITLDRGCTFCDICVQVCRPGALQMGRQAEEGTISLRYEASLCDGCAACEHWCPEKIIRVGQVQNGEQPQSGELVRTEMLACPSCGQLHAGGRAVPVQHTAPSLRFDT
jgi:TorA maturation chaperone TorD/NAD-dependent dihydropyrimidine dehydrogenase PreA subunit